MSHTPPFVGRFATETSGFVPAMEQLIEAAYAPGALEVKHKMLIALVLDVNSGYPAGTAIVAGLARAAGATDDEVREAIELAAAVKAIQVLYIGQHALSTK